MKVEKRFENEIRVAETLPTPFNGTTRMTIDVRPASTAVNVPCSGDLTPEGARTLAKMLLLAADLAERSLTLG